MQPMSVSSFLRALPRAFGMSEASGDSPDAIASSSAPPDHPEDPRPSPKPAPKQSPAKKRAAASAGGSVAAAATPPAGPPPPPQREAEGLKLCLSPTSNTGYTGVCMRLDKTKAGKLLYIRPPNTFGTSAAQIAQMCAVMCALSQNPPTGAEQGKKFYYEVVYSYRVKGKRKGVTLGQYETALEGALAYARHRLKEAAYTEQVASPSLQEQSASPPRATQSRDEPAASGDGPKRRRSLQASAKPSVADSAKPSVADSPKAKEAGSAPKGGRSSVRTGSQVSKTISKTSRARTARAKGGGPKGGQSTGARRSAGRPAALWDPKEFEHPDDVD